MLLALRHMTILVPALLAAGIAAGAERPWVEVKSPHFTIVTNGGEGQGREVAWQFEQMRAALQKLWPWAKLATDKPVLVFAARDEATLRALVPEYWEKGREPIVSITTEGRDRHYLAMRADTRMTEDVRMTPYFHLYRGYLQVVLGSSFERPLPLWLLRGMPELFGNLRVREKDVFLGRMIPWHVDRLREVRLLPLAELLAADRASPHFQEGDRRRLFDAESWAFLHYLLFGEEGRHAAALNRFFTIVAQGTGPDAARREAFPDLAALEKGLGVYLRRAGIPFSRLDVDVDIARERFPSRPLPPAESAALRAAFHVAMRRPTEARALIQEAKAADPAAPGAYDAEGLLAELEQKEDVAGAAYAKAAELGSTNFYTWYRNAQIAYRAGRDRETLGRVEKSLQRVVELNPEYAFGYSFLAETKQDLGLKDEALALARRAISLEPGGSYHHLALARVLFQQSKPDEARAEAERGRELAQADWEIKNARELIDYMNKVSSPAAATEQASPPAGLMEACLGGDGAACGRVTPDLERFCGGGEGRACTALGWIHESGKGVTADTAKAAALYKQGCEKGDKSGCARHGWLQARGEGMAKDEAGGMGALDRLCAEGFMEACTQLAVLHAGQQTKAGIARAKELLKKACEGGDEEACRILSSMPR
jgi:TPR repeat protein